MVFKYNKLSLLFQYLTAGVFPEGKQILESLLNNKQVHISNLTILLSSTKLTLLFNSKQSK